MDVYHYYGGDIGLSVKGDLQAVDSTLLGQQRILRRLLTAPGSYIWHPTYGAGLPSYIGQVLSQGKLQEITGLIRSQLLLEASVAKAPAPTITLSPIASGLFCEIKYTDSNTNTIQTLAFNVSE